MLSLIHRRALTTTLRKLDTRFSSFNEQDKRQDGAGKSGQKIRHINVEWILVKRNGTMCTVHCAVLRHAVPNFHFVGAFVS